MTSESVIDRLAALPLFESVPRRELDWLVAHGELRRWAAGTLLSETGIPARRDVHPARPAAWRSTCRRSGGSRKLLDAATGSVLGTIPYSRFQRAPGTVVVEETATAFVLHQRHFPTLIRDAHELTTALVRYMLDRSRALPFGTAQRRASGVAEPAGLRIRARAEQPGISGLAYGAIAGRPDRRGGARRPGARGGQAQRRSARRSRHDPARMCAFGAAANGARSRRPRG